MELPDELVILDFLTFDFELKHIQRFEPAFNLFVTGASGLPAVFQNGRRGSIYGGSVGSGNRVTSTLAGAVIEALAIAWHVPAKAIVGASSFDREVDVLVGSATTGDIRTKAFVVRRPSS
jgi:hypothetical protein